MVTDTATQNLKCNTTCFFKSKFHLMMFSLTLYPSAIECQVMNEIASKSLQLLSQSLKCLSYVCAKLLLISMWKGDFVSDFQKAFICLFFRNMTMRSILLQCTATSKMKGRTWKCCLLLWQKVTVLWNAVAWLVLIRDRFGQRSCTNTCSFKIFAQRTQ